LIINDNFFMQEALKEARKAFEKDEVPVGCVIVKDDKIIARAHNYTVKKNDPTAHAEIIAIRKAAGKIGNYRLTNCFMYVTIEPCPMCAGAAIWARIKKIIYGVCDVKSGACGSVVNIVKNKKFNHIIKTKQGLLGKECSNLLRTFFKRRR
jgi:tRNA(adenine34) deaminase